jgi:hypothetical protein
VTVVVPGETRVAAGASDVGETPSAPRSDDVRDRQEQLLSQIADLALLEPGWDGYGACTVDDAALRQAWEFAVIGSEQGLPLPEVFPTPTGGVQLEWCAGSMELEFEIEPGGTSAVFVGDDRRTGDRFDGQFPDAVQLFQQAVARLAAYR